MNFNIYVIRHGESVDNEVNDMIKAGQHNLVPASFYEIDDADYALTERGQNQARQLATHLAKLVGNDLTMLVTSPWKRARQTADHLANAIPNKVAFATENRFIERCFGNVNKLRRYPETALQTFDEFMRAFFDPNHRPFETGETFMEMMPRVLEGYASWAANAQVCRAKHLVVVCHGEVMRALRVHTHGIEPEKYRDHFPTKVRNAQLDEYTYIHPTTGQRGSTHWFRSTNLHEPEHSIDWQML